MNTRAGVALLEHAVGKIGARHSLQDIEDLEQIILLCLGLLDKDDRALVLERLAEALGGEEEPEEESAARRQGWPAYMQGEKVPEPVTKQEIDETENEYRVRLRDPADFQEDSFRQITIQEDPPIYGVVGRLIGETTVTLQALRFPKEDWTEAQVREWLDDHPDIGKSWWRWEDKVVVTALKDALTELKAHLAQQPDRVDKAYRAEVKAIDVPRHRIEAVISSPTVDRDRERVLPSAFKKVKGKPFAFVSSHDYGSTLKKQLGGMTVKTIAETEVTGEFDYLVGRGNEEADWAWVLATERLASFSIGFIPKKYEDANLDDPEVAREVLAGKVPLRTYTEIELLEVSQVIVPANRDAVLRAVEKGLFSAEEADLVAMLEEKGAAQPAQPDVLDVFSPPAPDLGNMPGPPVMQVVSLEDALRLASRTFTMDVKLSDEPFTRFTAQLKAAMEEVATRIEQAIASLPGIPKHIAEYPEPEVLAQAVGRIVAAHARRIAQEELAKVMGDVDHYRRT